jgi:GNAT superfamily N-acetyltransferase
MPAITAATTTIASRVVDWTAESFFGIPIRYVLSMPPDAPFVIRRAAEADAPTLGRLGAMLMRTHYSLDSKRFLAPGTNPEIGYGRFLRSRLRDDDSAVFVAEKGGVVIGYILAGLEPLSWKELRDACGFIEDVAVEESGRRAGVATALIEAAIDWLRSRGAPRVMLWTAEQNIAAQRLFARLGFRMTMREMTREIESP